MNDPKSIVQQANGTMKYSGKSAKVILNEDGKVVTTMGTKKSAYRGIKTQDVGRRTGGGTAQRRAIRETNGSYNPNMIRG